MISCTVPYFIKSFQEIEDMKTMRQELMDFLDLKGIRVTSLDATSFLKQVSLLYDRESVGSVNLVWNKALSLRHQVMKNPLNAFLDRGDISLYPGGKYVPTSFVPLQMTEESVLPLLDTVMGILLNDEKIHPSSFFAHYGIMAGSSDAAPDLLSHGFFLTCVAHRDDWITPLQVRDALLEKRGIDLREPPYLHLPFLMSAFPMTWSMGTQKGHVFGYGPEWNRLGFLSPLMLSCSTSSEEISFVYQEAA